LPCSNASDHEHFVCLQVFTSFLPLVVLNFEALIDAFEIIFCDWKYTTMLLIEFYDDIISNHMDH